MASNCYQRSYILNIYSFSFYSLRFQIKIVCNRSLEKKKKNCSDQTNSAFKIHHIPSTVSIDTTASSDRSVSAERNNHSNHDKKSNLNLVLPNGNLPKSRTPTFSSTPSTVLMITNEHEQQQIATVHQMHQPHQQQQQQQTSRKLSKLSIMEPIDSICWYTILQFPLLDLFYINLLFLTKTQQTRTQQNANYIIYSGYEGAPKIKINF